MVKKNAEYKGIQKKLVAAVAMVLVASIMVVTSSYAWFTLSTAPEVTGINTSVGSNGNLEIALRTDKNGTNIGNSEGAIFPAANNYWGNLVDLSNEIYHLDDIALMPAAIQATQITGEKITYSTNETKQFIDKDGNAINFDGGPMTEEQFAQLTGEELTAAQNVLATQGVVKSTVPAVYQFNNVAANSYIKVPEYGADGRVSVFNTTSFSGVYDTSLKGFEAKQNIDKYGVRAVGTSSNLDPAELAMMNARKAVSGAKSTALFGAKGSLSDDATKIANIVIKNQLNESDYSADVANVRAAITNLQTVTAALEDAIRSSVVALGVSQSITIDKAAITFDADNNYAIGGTGALLWVKAAGADPTTDPGYDHSNVKAMLETAYGKVAAMNSVLKKASEDLAPIEAGTTAASYSSLMGVVTNILKPADIQLDGKGVTEHSVADLASKLMGGSTPADVDIVDGIYCDIAEFVGNYNQPASLKVKGTFGSFGTVDQSVTVNMVTQATMPTTSNNGGNYLDSAYAWLNTLKAGTLNSEATLMSDLYAYIVDLAFRTNAANSNLLLQTEAADRVYQDATEGSATQGGGSYMEFTGSNTFSILQMVNLMKNIRVLFFDPDGNIIAVAGLDVDMPKVQKTNADGQKYVYGTTEGKVDYTKEVLEGAEGASTEPVYLQATDAEGVALYKDNLGHVTTDSTGNEPIYGTPNFTITSVANRTVQAKLYLYKYTIVDGKVTLNGKAEKQAITSLDQNVVKALSAMVYLDGNEVQNADVAIGGNSMTGKLNLQFASDATLEPMDYTFGEALKAPTASISGNTLTITPNAENGAKATTYKISVGAFSTTINASEGLTFDLSTLTGQVPAGTYQIKIAAAGVGYMDSPAYTIEYTVPAAQAGG